MQGITRELLVEIFIRWRMNRKFLIRGHRFRGGRGGAKLNVPSRNRAPDNLVTHASFQVVINNFSLGRNGPY